MVVIEKLYHAGGAIRKINACEDVLEQYWYVGDVLEKLKLIGDVIYQYYQTSEVNTMNMEARYDMERQRELQVNTTKFTKILAIKNGWKGKYGAATCRCEKQIQIERVDVFEKYKHNLVGVNEQVNCLHMGKLTLSHDLWRDMIKKRQKWAKMVRIISVRAADRIKKEFISQ